MIIFCLDTVRADRLGLYGGPRPTTPNLDRLASEGAVFEDAQSPSPWTLPSVASLLTGLHPRRHGAGLDSELRNLATIAPLGLSGTRTTLAERFAAVGYRCEAFVTNPLLRAELKQGFEVFHYRQTEGAEVAAYAVEALRRLRDEPFFLWLHFMDAHDPLLIPVEDVIAVLQPGEKVGTGAIWARSFRGHRRSGFRIQRLLLYDAALHYIDRQIGVVLAELDRQGREENTIVVVVADHGEEVFDHLETARTAGYEDPRGLLGLGHGHTLFVEQLRVPLILCGPGIPARRISELVSLIDLTPTLLELSGVEAAAGEVDGRSLRPLLAGATWEERPLLAGSLAYGPDRRAWITPRWKLILGGENEAPLLFDRRSDPFETDDLASAKPDLVLDLTRRLESYEEALPIETGARLFLGEEDIEVLRALGYVGEEPSDR